MRLTCPNCDARYEVGDGVVPFSGRDVQCSNCGQTWFQKHPDAGLDAEDEDIDGFGDVAPAAVSSAAAGPARQDAPPPPESQSRMRRPAASRTEAPAPAVVQPKRPPRNVQPSAGTAPPEAAVRSMEAPAMEAPSVWAPAVQAPAVQAPAGSTTSDEMSPLSAAPGPVSPPPTARTIAQARPSAHAAPPVWSPEDDEDYLDSTDLSRHLPRPV